MRKIAALGLVMLLTFNIICLTACRAPGVEGEYTYRSYTSALGNNWNPHTWETSADRAVMDYLTTPLVSILPLDSSVGSYQWSFDMAKSVTDVTESAREDLIKYKVNLGKDRDVNSVDKGYVYEIELREGLMFENGNEITADDFIESMKLLLDPKMKNNRANLYVTGESALAGASAYFNGKDSFDGVGCYKTGELSFRYVTESYLDYNYFLASLASHWLVDAEIYNRGLVTNGELVSTDYGTSIDTTSSYGPYRIESHQGEKELVLVRNEMWYGWQKDDKGDIVSYTTCDVDGEVREQYMTTKVVISVMDSATAKQSFLRGELSEWAPSASEYNTYRYSDGLYRTNETYTMSLFFNSNKDALLAMDRSRGNLNSVVLSSDAFRRGMSLAIDRDEFSLATEGYRPQYALLNDMYYYDIYADPSSRYRDTPEAKAALCRLYGLTYGDGAVYKTLDEAYRSITGHDIEGAKAEFKTAFKELTESGLYRAGEEIKIRVAWAKGALSADDNQQVALLERHINLALSDSGFGKLSLIPVSRVSNRYAAVPNGEYAIGYGAWGGAAFYPFRNFLVYMDPEYENLHEAACWSPETETLTLTVDGVERTMTYQAWARSLTGSGEYSARDALTKLTICTALEESFLSRFYRIPLVSSSSSALLSYQIENYTDTYNVMYGFGGFRLLKYHYDDKAWSEYVRDAGGRLKYE